ncbi:MAG: TonB-dependent receptor [Muribaculaceae bacterium]
MLLLCFPSFAQNIPISGHVVDEKGEPIIGSSIFVKGTKIGTATDFDGNFNLSVPAQNSILEISYIGFNKLEISANSPLLKSGIVLKENTQALDEVLVIGYGSVKKSDATGSVIAMKPDEFNKGNRVSAQEALVGKVAGVNVVTGSGAPGSGATIRIRSGASLSASNDPLIVIDGVPVDNSSIEGSSNIIGSINPEDIETFTVLKDASATAIYGSRASNGVIVITTKKGTDKTSVNYTGNFSISTTTKQLKVLSADEFRAFVPTVTGVPTGIKLGDANTNWQDAIYRTAFGTEHNISVAGKINPISSPYRVSLGYTNQDGVIKNNNYQRLSFGGSLAPNFFDNHLAVNLNLKVSYENNRKVEDSVVGNALRYDPTRPIFTGSATAATDPGLGYFIWTNGNSPMAIQTDNPMAQIDLVDQRNKIIRSIGSGAITYKIHGLEDLKLNVNLGYDILRSKYEKNVPQLAGMMYTGNQKDGTGLVLNATQDKRNYLLDAFANYDKTIAEKHTFGVMAGYGWQHFWKKYNATNADPNGKELSTAQHYETENYLLSFYGRLNYSFDNRYLLTATLRSDASSRFAPKNRWGLFPSVALAWRIIQEDFMKEQSVLSDLKLRLGYGVTGQQDIINDYPYMTTFSVSYPESMYQFGDQWYNTYRPNGYDEDIKWETTTTWNVGIDFGFLQNRISGSVDYYKRFTKDLLNTINVISGTNYAPVITTNIGQMENQGVEIALNAVPIRTKDWEWNIGLNYTWTDSKITKLNVIDTGNNFVNTGAISGTGKTVQVFMVGKTPYTFYLAKQAYDEAGKAIEGKYVQPDGSISATETKYATDKSALPTAYMGFNTRVSYKNWDLALSGHGSFGNYVYNYVAADQYVQSVYSDQGNFSNILQSTKDNGFQSQQLYSDMWLEKGSFFRFDNITLGYTFNKLWNKDSRLRVTFGVQNIATISSYSGIDPELYSGIDREVYPRPRTYSLGLNLTF